MSTPKPDFISRSQHARLSWFEGLSRNTLSNLETAAMLSAVLCAFVALCACAGLLVGAVSGYASIAIICALITAAFYGGYRKSMDFMMRCSDRERLLRDRRVRR